MWEIATTGDWDQWGEFENVIALSKGHQWGWFCLPRAHPLDVSIGFNIKLYPSFLSVSWTAARSLPRILRCLVSFFFWVKYIWFILTPRVWKTHAILKIWGKISHLQFIKVRTEMRIFHVYTGHFELGVCVAPRLATEPFHPATWLWTSYLPSQGRGLRSACLNSPKIIKDGQHLLQIPPLLVIVHEEPTFPLRYPPVFLREIPPISL